VTGPTVCAPELPIVTVSPETGFPFTSVTVAVAVDVETPFAVTDGGLSVSEIPVAGPASWVSVAAPEGCRLAVMSVAVIVACPATVVEVIVA
jgi:hypothetical protein